MKALFYEGEPYQGKPTRVFAWYGAPKTKKGEKVPAVVLVHGGNGIAKKEWVRLWNEHGYAAIMMDHEGQLPDEDIPAHLRTQHEWAGPQVKTFLTKTAEPLKDQWMYHAVADVILAHSLIRTYPEVDKNRIGVTGISMGGIIVCNIAGIDKRFRFAVPVYGCGYLFEADNYFGRKFQNLSRPDRKTAVIYWDPSSHLGQADMPMLWINGQDLHFPLNIFQRSYRQASGPQTLRVHMDMAHGHGPGYSPKEIYAFADSIVKNGKPLPQITGQGREGKKAWVKFQSQTKIVKAELCWTESQGEWLKRKWTRRKVKVEPGEKMIWGLLPDNVTVYFFNLYDEMGLFISSEHVEIHKGTGK